VYLLPWLSAQYRIAGTFGDKPSKRVIDDIFVDSLNKVQIKTNGKTLGTPQKHQKKGA